MMMKQGRVMAGSPDEAAAQIIDKLGHDYVRLTVKPVLHLAGQYEYCYTYKGEDTEWTSPSELTTPQKTC